jgi:hypothetical protein
MISRLAALKPTSLSTLFGRSLIVFALSVSCGDEAADAPEATPLVQQAVYTRPTPEQPGTETGKPVKSPNPCERKGPPPLELAGLPPSAAAHERIPDVQRPEKPVPGPVAPAAPVNKETAERYRRLEDEAEKHRPFWNGLSKEDRKAAYDRLKRQVVLDE